MKEDIEGEFFEKAQGSGFRRDLRAGADLAGNMGFKFIGLTLYCMMILCTLLESVKGAQFFAVALGLIVLWAFFHIADRRQ